MSRLARVSLLVLAAVACAWFALSTVQARDTGRATSLLTRSSTLSPHEAARAQRLLDSAGRLNPDQTVDILRGLLESDQHRFAEAEQTLLSVTRSEPMNVDAWVQLAFVAARNGDRKLAVFAGHQASRLHPAVR